jgi:plasmid stabilization system protein ParE
MKVRYTPRAFADREAIFSYINQSNPRAAEDIKAFLEKRISELGKLKIRHRMVPSPTSR